MAQLLYNLLDPEAVLLDFNETALGAARRSELDRYIFVVPTYRMQRDLDLKLTRAHHEATGRPIERLHLYTMEGLARRLFAGVGPGRRDISGELQRALTRLAMENADLRFFARPDRPPSPGVVERIARIIAGIRADGMLPARLLEDIRYAESHPDAAGYDVGKLHDLHAIYDEYLRLLDSYWIDSPGRMLQVNAALLEDHDEVFRRVFPSATHLLVCGYTELSQPELMLLEGLGHVADLRVSIYFDYASENGPLYGNFDESIERLKNAGYDRFDLDPLDDGVAEEERRPFKHHMRRNLFRTDQRIANPAFDELINVYGFHGRDEEAEGIAALIKWRVIEEGIAPERICVAASDIEPYAPLLRTHMAEYGIPCIAATHFPLAESPLITAIFAALTIPVSGFARRDVIRAVTSPYLSFGAEIDPAALTAAAAQLRITRGRESWRRRIGQKIELVEGYMLRLTDEEERRVQAEELDLLRRAGRGFDHLAHRLEGLERELSAAEFRQTVHGFVARMRVAENILALRRSLDARPRAPLEWQRVHDGIEQDTRALARFLELVDELAEFFEVKDDLARGDQTRERRPLEFYLDHLRTAAARARFEIREKQGFGVSILPIHQLRGLQFDVVILCGMVDGEFPGTYIPEIFLGRPLPRAEERRMRRERIEFYQAITSFSRSLVLTYPRFAGERALVRSSFVDAFLRITTVEERGRVVELDELRAERARIRDEGSATPHTAFVAMIGSPNALAEEAGEALWSGAELPRFDDPSGIIEHLRFTAAIEQGRHRAELGADTAAVPEYRGIIGAALAPEERAELEEYRGREYSVSQLELYGRCPFKYFARRILAANAPTSFDVSLTPLERGTLLHRVLFRLYVELREHDELPVTEITRGAALARARALAREEIAGIVFDHPYWRIDQERLLGSDQVDGLLEQWIEYEATRRSDKSELAPAFFETGFGSSTVRGGTSDPLLTSDARMPLHGIAVRGKVDRIELFYHGDILYFAVADYKTGHAPSAEDVRRGLSLQLMIYLEAVRQILATHFALPLLDVRPVGGIYYQLKPRESDIDVSYLFVPNEVRKSVVHMNRSSSAPETIEELEEVVALAFEFARDYVEGISTGQFPTTRHDLDVACRGCDYRGSCRIVEGGGAARR